MDKLASSKESKQSKKKGLRSSSEAVEVVQLASGSGGVPDLRMSSRSDGNVRQKAQVTPSLKEFIDFDKIMAQSDWDLLKPSQTHFWTHSEHHFQVGRRLCA